MNHIYHSRPIASKAEISAIETFLAGTKKRSDFQRVQCVLLRYKFNMSSLQVSEITSLKPGTVRKIWSQYNNHGMESLLCKNKGGRKNSHMTVAEEKLFLSPFFRKADQDGQLVVAQLKASYEKRIGHEVPKSTIYRLLKRHGWQKKPGIRAPEVPAAESKKGELNNYWIKGCTQAILPKKSGNIAQHWLNRTLNSMLGANEIDQQEEGEANNLPTL